MTKLTIDLEHCYGIKRLSHTLDFSSERSFAIYAPNGTMKSSLAATFADLANGTTTADRHFPGRATKRVLSDEAGVTLPSDSVFVIPPYDEAFETGKASTLLVNALLRKEYEALHERVDLAKTALFEALTKQARTKSDVASELMKVFGKEGKTLLSTLNGIRAKLSVEGNDAPFKDIEYDAIFDERIVGVLETDPIKAAIEDYIQRYNELLAGSKYFKKDVFNYFDGGEVAKNLGTHGFFNAGHQVVLHGDANADIVSQKDLENLIKEEKDKISDDPEIRKKFAEIEKALKKNITLRNFEAYLCDHQELLPLLANLQAAKEAVWYSYLKANFALLRDLVDKSEKSEKRRGEIERQAAKERTRWESVVEIFNARFFVPFKLSVSNKVTAMLGAGAPVLQFIFEDGADNVAVERDALFRALSQGEKKALYILNVIFEVEARIHARQETLFVVDDIADSFDYKNKYAIIQYLHDIQDVPHFRLLILTHNFDFFRTLESRFLPYSHCLMAVKTITGLRLEQGVGIRNIFVKGWKPAFFTDAKKRIACIPFQRNLIEYTNGVLDPVYGKLTSLLHWRADTATFTQGDLDQLFVGQFSVPGAWPNPGNVVVDDIFVEAQACLTEPEGVNFENKIVLSIAIRLAAERHMVSKINDAPFVAQIAANQTAVLINRFNSQFPMEVDAREALQRVQLMTPESIHLNSFMYEPILDMSDDHLRKLYQDVVALK